MGIPPFAPCPATGDSFIGRQGLVRNLRGRIARGESLAVIGGPKLGKTSLVRTALHGLDHTVIEIDCGAESSPRIDVVPGSRSEERRVGKAGGVRMAWEVLSE